MEKVQKATRTPLVVPENVQPPVLTDQAVRSPDCDTVLAANSRKELRESLSHSLRSDDEWAEVPGDRAVFRRLLSLLLPLWDALPLCPILPSGPEQRFCLIFELQKSTYPST